MLSIGEFSRLSRVSPRMLRHYDAIGLLRPEAVGSNGYRYYRQEQLRDIVAIQRWKEYGFPLCEIGELLKLSGPEQAQRLWRRCQAFREDLRAGGALLRRMEADALRMKGANAMENQYQVIVMEDPAQKVFSIRRTIGVAEYHTLFEDLRRGRRSGAFIRRGLSKCAILTSASTRRTPTWRPRWWSRATARMSRRSRRLPARRWNIGGAMRRCTWPMRRCARGWRSTQSTGCARRRWIGI